MNFCSVSTLSFEMGCKDTDFFFTSKSFLKNIFRNFVFNPCLLLFKTGR